MKLPKKCRTLLVRGEIYRYQLGRGLSSPDLRTGDLSVQAASDPPGGVARVLLGWLKSTPPGTEDLCQVVDAILEEGWDPESPEDFARAAPYPLSAAAHALMLEHSSSLPPPGTLCQVCDRPGSVYTPGADGHQVAVCGDCFFRVIVDLDRAPDPGIPILRGPQPQARARFVPAGSSSVFYTLPIDHRRSG